jgi:outer membrane biosynthesis protein TonB
MKNRFFIFGGVVSVGFYIALLIGLYLYLKEHNQKKYLSAGDKGIAISLAQKPKVEPKKIEKKVTPKPKPKIEKKKPVTKPKKVQKPKPKPKPQAKKIEKPKPKPKPKIEKQKPQPKVESVDDLFSDINTDKPKEKKNIIKTSDKPKVSSNRSASKGEKNAYANKIQSKLEHAIPMDEQFVGCRVDVKLTIYKNGDFRFQVVRYDSNTEYNEIIIRYLEQLQSIGLDAHKSTKPYKFTVELIAKE